MLRGFDKQASVPTFEKVAEEFLANSRNPAITVKDYRNMLFDRCCLSWGMSRP